MINVFVSSTFRDMDYERDLLHDEIIPEINEYCRPYGEQIQLCDLRWGIDTSGFNEIDSSKKVLSVCQDEIDRCKPYIISFLGERYGWVPNIDDLLDDSEYYISQNMIGKSVTELEIQYGALTCNNPNAFFYFRKLDGDPPRDYMSESEDSNKKLTALKREIRNKADERVRTYNVIWKDNVMVGLEQLKAIVISDLKRIVDKELSIYKHLSDFEKDQRQNWSLAEVKNIQYSYRPDIENNIQRFINEGVKIIGIKGKSGSGKSSLASHFTYEFGNQGMYVLPVFCGNTKSSLSLIGITQYICSFFQENFGYMILGENSRSNIDIVEKMNYFLSRYSREQQRHLVIILDAIDQMAVGASSILGIFRYIPDKITVLLTYTDKYIPEKPIKYIELRDMDTEDRRKILQGILHSNVNKISKTVFTKIVEMTSISTPLQLGIIYNILLMFDREDFGKMRKGNDGLSEIEKINLYQIELIRQIQNDIGKYYLDRLSLKINKNLIDVVICYIAFSRQGLREKDLEELVSRNCPNLNWNYLDFCRFVKLAGQYLIERADGRYDFAHLYFRDVAASQYDDFQKQKIMVDLITYMNELPYDDSLRINDEIPLCLSLDEKKIDIVTDYIEQVLMMEYSESENIEHVKMVESQLMRHIYNTITIDSGETLRLVTLSVIQKFDENLDDYLNLFCNELLVNNMQGDCDINILLKNVNVLIAYVFYKYNIDNETSFFRRHLIIPDLFVQNSSENIMKEFGRSSIIKGFIRLAGVCEQRKDDIENLWQGIYYGEIALALLEKYNNNWMMIDSSSGEVYWMLASMYTSMGELEYSQKNIIRSIECSFRCLRENIGDKEEICHQLYLEYILLAKIRSGIGYSSDYVEKLLQRAIFVHDKYLEKYYDADEAYMALASICFQKGRYSDARIYALKAVYILEKYASMRPGYHMNRKLFDAYVVLVYIDKNIDEDTWHEEMEILKDKMAELLEWSEEEGDNGRESNWL